MAMKRIAGILAAIILVSGIIGCAMGNEGTVHYNRTTTIGKELLDLKMTIDSMQIDNAQVTKAKAGDSNWREGQ